jgi:hypothetical protein
MPFLAYNRMNFNEVTEFVYHPLSLLNKYNLCFLLQCEFKPNLYIASPAPNHFIIK